MAQAIEQDDGANAKSANVNNKNNNSSSSKNEKMIKLKRSMSETSKKFESGLSKLSNKAKDTSQIIVDKSKERLSLEGQLLQARISLQRFVDPKLFNKSLKEDQMIPKWVLSKAKGIVFLSVVKIGFLVAGAGGTGIIMIKKKNGQWSYPSSIGIGGISFGLLAGGSKIDYIMILPDDKSVEQFIKNNNQIRLGGELQIAVGPLGREASGSASLSGGDVHNIKNIKKDMKMSVIYSYSHSQGLYGGISLDGTMLTIRNDCNEHFYKKKLTNFDILNPNNINDNNNNNNNNISMPPNEDYDMIVHLLDSYCNNNNNNNNNNNSNGIMQQGEKISIDDLNISEQTNQTKSKSGSNK